MQTFSTRGAARYQFTDAYSSETFEVTGSAAITEGIEIEQEPMSSNR